MDPSESGIVLTITDNGALVSHQLRDTLRVEVVQDADVKPKALDPGKNVIDSLKQS